MAKNSTFMQISQWVFFQFRFFFLLLRFGRNSNFEKFLLMNPNQDSMISTWIFVHNVQLKSNWSCQVPSQDENNKFGNLSSLSHVVLVSPFYFLFDPNGFYSSMAQRIKRSWLKVNFSSSVFQGLAYSLFCKVCLPFLGDDSLESSFFRIQLQNKLHDLVELLDQFFDQIIIALVFHNFEKHLFLWVGNSPAFDCEWGQKVADMCR